MTERGDSNHDERTEVDRSLAPQRIPGWVLGELQAHAMETLPEECCGLLTGVPEEPYRQVHRCRNTMTLQHQSDPVAFPRDGRRAYYMAEADMLRAQKAADEAGEQVTAIYHSHVGAGAYLSQMDRAFADQELFPFPDALQIVLGVGESRVLEAAVFERSKPGGPFRGRLLEAG